MARFSKSTRKMGRSRRMKHVKMLVGGAVQRLTHAQCDSPSWPAEIFGESTRMSEGAPGYSTLCSQDTLPFRKPIFTTSNEPFAVGRFTLTTICFSSWQSMVAVMAPRIRDETFDIPTLFPSSNASLWAWKTDMLQVGCWIESLFSFREHFSVSVISLMCLFEHTESRARCCGL